MGLVKRPAQATRGPNPSIVECVDKTRLGGHSLLVPEAMWLNVMTPIQTAFEVGSLTVL